MCTHSGEALEVFASREGNAGDGLASMDAGLILGLKGEEVADGVHRSDAKASNSANQRSMYAKREQIYPKLVNGPWRGIKWVMLVVLLGIYYVVPFLRWDRGDAKPSQMILFDFPGRRMYFGPIELWPQEVYIITGILILAALGLFLATALFGRVWCGFACPQTIWTDLFILVERLFEGDRNQRMRLDKQKMSFNKAWRKGGKHAVWLIIALSTGGWFVAYFHDAPTLLVGFFTGDAPLSAYGFAALLTFTTYMLAGTLREQVCTYMCPWPRIQGAMIDQEALSVTYRKDRGETRGPHKKNETWEGRGDCIDCRACVAACPAGIDIRDGMQFECINCALCIDACDEIMVKIGRPKGLIAFDNDLNIQRRTVGEKARYRFFRPRTFFYAALLLAVSSVMLGALVLRSPMDVNVIRDRSPTFVMLSNGDVRNAYTVKVLNKADTARSVQVTIEGVEGATIKTANGSVTNGGVRLEIAPDRVATARLFVIAQPSTLSSRSIPVRISVRDVENGETATSTSSFIRGRS